MINVDLCVLLSYLMAVGTCGIETSANSQGAVLGWFEDKLTNGGQHATTITRYLLLSYNTISAVRHWIVLEKAKLKLR